MAKGALNKGKSRVLLKKIGKGFLVLALSMAFLVLALEIIWRNQWIDLYSRELKALNPDHESPKSGKLILAMGDSFTAAQNSWVNALRTIRPNDQVINSAVPGTGILQADVMLEGRLERFQPDLLIYQIYVGNDLFDLEYPLNWQEIGFGRNCYWWLANHVRSIGWLNYALGQWKNAANLPDHIPEKANDSIFDPSRYSSRELLYLKALPSLIADQILLEGFAEKAMEEYEESLEELLESAQERQIPVLLVVLPHQAQMNAKMAGRIGSLGATGLDNPAIFWSSYPFISRMESHSKQKNVFVLNMLPIFQAEDNAGQACYYTHDPHLSDIGQKMLAQGIAQQLQSMGF
jgi:hypothetical protein